MHLREIDEGLANANALINHYNSIGKNGPIRILALVTEQREIQTRINTISKQMREAPAKVIEYRVRISDLEKRKNYVTMRRDSKGTPKTPEQKLREMKAQMAVLSMEILEMELGDK
jgi:hypothetical protein